MPSKTSEALEALVTKRYPISAEIWGDFWDRLNAGELLPGEGLAVVTSLTSQIPDGTSVSALLASLRERNPEPTPPSRPTVNIVGTGGGPSTFNLSTASAFVGAAMGARVIKTGSRAYASKTGSVDLLDRLGVKLTGSYEETEEMLETFGIACCGPFVYPKELRLIARGILPFGMKTVGRFFNVIGPFLAAIPVTTQITGASDHSVLPTFHQLVSEDRDKRFWIVSNELGVDELLSIVPTRVYDSGTGEDFTLDPRDVDLGAGSFDDLLPVPDLDQTVPHFLALLSGDGPPAALESIMLNAGALAMHGGVVEDLQAGVRLAATTLESGETVRLIERIKAHASAGAPVP